MKTRDSLWICGAVGLATACLAPQPSQNASSSGSNPGQTPFGEGAAEGTTPSGAAGAAAVGPSVMAGGAARDCGEGERYSAVDDVEDGDSDILFTGPRDGAWYSATDQNGSRFRSDEIESVSGGANATKRAMRFSGQVADKPGSYVMVGLTMSSNDMYDASNYGGVSFWAKARRPTKIRVTVPDEQTDAQGGKCKACFNHFGKDVELTTEWTQFTIRFDEMSQQQGWGDQFPKLDTQAIVGVQWQLARKGEPFAFWLDEVQLLCPDPE